MFILESTFCETRILVNTSPQIKIKGAIIEMSNRRVNKPGVLVSSAIAFCQNWKYMNGVTVPKCPIEAAITLTSITPATA